MKKIVLALCTVSLLFTACKKEDSHGMHTSENALLRIMYNMHTSMDTMTMTQDPDHDFAMMMKSHHTGAVNMATYELTNGTDATIKAMAQQMKDDQTREIAQLDSFMRVHTPAGMSMAMMDSLDASMMRMSVQSDAQVLKNQSDHDFTHLMIVHHQSAIDMAKAAKMYAQTAFVKNMADMIIAAQTQEIAAMNAWLNAGND
jgi:uncharacterized protein (DUF305 family)